MNKKAKIALLASWGITVNAETITLATLNRLVFMGQETARAAVTANAQNAFAGITCGEIPEPEEEEETAAPAPAARVDVNAVDFSQHPTVRAMQASLDRQRRETIHASVVHAASAEGGSLIPLNEVDNWVNDALAVPDGPTGNPVINRLKKLEPRNLGVTPLNPVIEMPEGPMNIAQLEKAVKALKAPQNHISHNGIITQNQTTRELIGANAKQLSMVVNRLKKFDYTNNKQGELVGPLREAWDNWAMGVQNANTMSADLLRQVILSEFMRAFKREFASLNLFAHNYGNVALQGNNKVEVPYYPLDTVASTEYSQAAGYVITPNAQTLSKEVYVGGIGDGVATAGSGRKYKGLQFSAYEIARQPWLNIAQLIVMAAEQLAIDVRADILGSKISQANFGNAIWSGAAGAFDSNVVALYLQAAAINAFWPMGARNMVLTTNYYTNLSADPYVKAFLNIGDTSNIRDGKIGGLYGFKDTIYDALLPVPNYIRGGDGTVTAGADPYLAGFIAYPSAILLATAPIMPGPATMRLLAAFEQVTDDQTGLSFTYQYFGNPLGSKDNEIIECSYGSGLGEIAALKRIVSQGV